MIQNQKDLDALIPLVQVSEWLGLDTEADSLHAYPEKLCLIQMRVGEEEFLLDTLESLDFTRLFQAITPKLLLFHAADYDLRLLFRAYGFVPEQIFDTMLAARLLGYEPFGLAALVERFLGVVLQKGSRKSDWAQRPLTSKMVQYALNDIRYLPPLADILRQELSARGRLEWHHQYCLKQVREAVVPPVVDSERFWRLKGSNGMSSRALAILRSLFLWREKLATERNRPPYFIISHEQLVWISRKFEQTPLSELKKCLRVPTWKIQGIEEAIEAALALPEKELPRKRLPVPAPLPKGPRYQAQFDRLKDIRDQKAESLGIDPSLIASKYQLARLASDWDLYSGELMPWQKELLSENY